MLPTKGTTSTPRDAKPASGAPALKAPRAPMPTPSPDVKAAGAAPRPGAAAGIGRGVPTTPRPPLPAPRAHAAGDHLGFERIGEVKLKGFSESTELFLATRAEVS